MRRMIPLALAVGLSAAIPAASVTCLAAQTTEGAEEEVRRTLESYAELAQAGDLAGMGELVAQRGGVHFIEGAGVNHGWVQYRDEHLAPELEHFTDLSYRYFAVEPRVRGDVAYSAFRYELQAGTPEGPIDIEGRGTAVLERLDGRWQIVHLHTSGRPR